MEEGDEGRGRYQHVSDGVTSLHALSLLSLQLQYIFVGTGRFRSSQAANASSGRRGRSSGGFLTIAHPAGSSTEALCRIDKALKWAAAFNVSTVNTNLFPFIKLNRIGGPRIETHVTEKICCAAANVSTLSPPPR